MMLGIANTGGLSKYYSALCRNRNYSKVEVEKRKEKKIDFKAANLTERQPHSLAN
jgi:hypothetical protein